MADPPRKLARARRDARRFAAEARKLGARRGKRITKKAREEIDAAARAVEAAAEGGDPDKLSSALRDLDALWGEHLARGSRPIWREYGEAIAIAVAVALLVRAFVVEAFRIPSGSMAPTLLAGDHILVSKLAYGLRVPFTHFRLVPLGAPRRGDVIVFESPRDRSTDVVKRVVGVPGDVVELREQILFVNGLAQPRTPGGEITYEDLSDETGKRFEDTCRRYGEALAKGEIAVPDPDLPGTREASWQAAAAAGVAMYDVLQCRRVRLASREGPFEAVKPGNVFVLGDNRDRSADSRGLGGWQVPLGHVKGRATLVFWSWGRGGSSPWRGSGVRFDRLFKPVE